MGFKAIRESWNRNRREMGDQDAKRRKLKEKKKGFAPWILFDCFEEKFLYPLECREVPSGS